MSYWLNAAKAHKLNSKPLPDTATKGDKSPHVEKDATFCRVLSGCRVENSKKVCDDASADIQVQIQQFRDRATALEWGGGLTRDKAVWMAALSVFVLPDERAEFFDQHDNLTPGRKQLSIALEGGLRTADSCHWPS